MSKYIKLEDAIERSETMSGSKWAYDPEKCDGEMCIGDCDICPKREEPEVEEE